MTRAGVERLEAEVVEDEEIGATEGFDECLSEQKLSRMNFFNDSMLAA